MLKMKMATLNGLALKASKEEIIMKSYIKPEAKINSFISEDVITTSGTSTPTVQELIAKGYSIGTVKNLFKN